MTTSASFKLFFLLLIFKQITDLNAKQIENDEAGENNNKEQEATDARRDNNILVKHLVKLTNQQLVDLSVKNQAIEKRIQECFLNTTNLMKHGNSNLVNSQLVENKDEIRLLLSTIYNDLKIALLVFNLFFLVPLKSILLFLL